MTYNQLLDRVTDQMRDRLEQRADQFSNKDLLDYMDKMVNALEKTQKQIASIDPSPTIQINQQNNVTLNANNSNNLSEESRQKILDVVSSLLYNVGNNEDIQTISDINISDLIPVSTPETSTDNEMVEEENDDKPFLI